MLGIGLRNPNPPHTGTCTGCGGATGGGGCCIVASVATGSAYSDEVNALRAVRDGVLRYSDIGFDFFHRLHEDYYAFSPEVCRLMAQSPPLHERVRLYFVGPLTRCLQLMHQYTMGGVDTVALGAAFVCGVEGSELASMQQGDVQEALRLLGKIGNPESALPAELADFAGVLEESARTSDYIRWALLEPIEIYAHALGWRLEGHSSEELGQRIASEFDAWAMRIPLTEAWEKLSNYDLAKELAFLKRVLLRTEAARRKVGRRLVDILQPDTIKRATMKDAGFLANEQEES